MKINAIKTITLLLSGFGVWMWVSVASANGDSYVHEEPVVMMPPEVVVCTYRVPHVQMDMNRKECHLITVDELHDEMVYIYRD